MRARNARPYGVDAAFGAPSHGPEWRAEVVAQASFSCRCAAIHLLAPYGVAAVPLPLTRQMGGNLQSVTYSYARSAS